MGHREKLSLIERNTKLATRRGFAATGQAGVRNTAPRESITYRLGGVAVATRALSIRVGAPLVSARRHRTKPVLLQVTVGTLFALYVRPLQAPGQGTCQQKEKSEQPQVSPLAKHGSRNFGRRPEKSVDSQTSVRSPRWHQTCWAVRTCVT